MDENRHAFINGTSILFFVSRRGDQSLRETQDFFSSIERNDDSQQAKERERSSNERAVPESLTRDGIKSTHTDVGDDEKLGLSGTYRGDVVADVVDEHLVLDVLKKRIVQKIHQVYVRQRHH